MFLAWQSETLSVANRRGIEAALRAAASNVERTIAGQELSILIDKDTFNRAGSPAIADTILEKIARCDVFIGDVTITNPDDTVARRSPNANVLIELGYAAGVQGWDRVISVFNTACNCELPDLPFDLRHRRITTFTLTDEAAKTMKNKADDRLTKALGEALTSIVVKNPARPADLRGLSDDKIKKRRDVENLTWLLCRVHWPTLEQYIQQGPHLRSAALMDFWEQFEHVLSSIHFHLYDEALSQKIATLRRAWSEAMSHPENYKAVRDGRWYVFMTPRSLREYENLEGITNGVAQLRPAVDDLLNHIRTQFLEIDIKALSEAAGNRYVEVQHTLDERLG